MRACDYCHKTPCNLCKGKGRVTESKHEKPYDRGDGVTYGSSSWTSTKCPHGCPDATRVIL